jgi:transcriptional antiterminator RfaH
MRRWYVVHSQPNSERRALENLARQGYDAWLPLCRRRRRHARKTETVLRPLFPRYLFLEADLGTTPWRPVLSTYGVAGLITGPSGPVPVPDAVIAALRARADAAGVVPLEPDALESGAKVRLSAGPLAELEGVFEARTDAERVAVLLKLMGRAVRVVVPVGDIEPL